ncbi:sortase domain-bontaining protein [Nocardioides sp. Bht2]|uniref:DUF7507 domain-containing protein n=1 Tax=Nocardioides sp. Bht2 TaxID=3392297 RepID=UPI0039B4F4BF
MTARRRTMRWSVVIIMMAGLLAGVPFQAANAAGAGVLDLQITPINLTSGNPITETTNGDNANQITYRVQFACTGADCDNAKVQMSTAPTDPHGLLPAGEWILKYASWVAPSSGGTIGGTDITGKVIDLGNLVAGTSNTFTVTYGYQPSRNREVPNGSFYPDGFNILMSATLTSDTATAPITRTAAPVTWRIGTPTGPSAGLAPANGSFKTDVPVDYRVSVNPGNMIWNPGANQAGSADLVATGNYKIVQTVPAEAVIQSASDGGVIDNVNHTVTWTRGTAAAPSYGARGGWGLMAFSGYNSGGAALHNSLVPDDDDAFWGPRSVTVIFPGTNFPEADANGCNFTKQVTSSVDVSVNYLDTARTLGTTNGSINNQVACTSPFGGLEVNKAISNGFSSQFSYGDGNLGGNPTVYAVNVPAAGETDNGNREWRVAVSNRGNVAASAVIDETNLVHDHIRVHRIYAYAYSGAPAGWEATVEWVDNVGDTGTSQVAASQFVEAAPGRWFVSARTTAPLAAGRILPSDTTQTTMQMGYRFRVDDGAIPKIGEERTNTANVTLNYPADADEDGSPDNYLTVGGQPLPSRAVSADAVRTARYTQPTPALIAGFTTAPVVDAGGNPAVGSEVTYSMRARMDDPWPGTALRPQLTFVAPAGWEIVPGSASFTAPGTGVTATAPAGVTFDYATRTVAGEQRRVVVATWPVTVTVNPAVNDYWPTLTVKASPTNSAAVGTGVTATVLAGDQSGAWRDAVGTGYVSGPNQFRAEANAYLDAGDVDADNDSTEEFASTASGALVVAASDGLRVVKSLCIPDAGEPDGCNWVSNPTQVHKVPVDASDIQYRILLQNTGNTTLNDVVSYDVLPHVGDTGLLAGASARGSEFALTVDSVVSASTGLSVDFSGSINPARPEVNPGAAGTVNDWNATAAGKKAIRIAVDGPLAAGVSKEVVFSAAVGSGAAAGQKACNTVAVDSNETLPAEPLAVCVTLDEADLAIALSETAPLIPGTTGSLGYTVTNKGGNDTASATVELDVPAGISVTDLSAAGWECTTPAGAAPVVGPATLTCEAVDGSGDPRMLAEDVPDALVLQISVGAGVTGTELCFPAAVAGPAYDPVMANNETAGCRAIGSLADPSLALVKTAALTTDGGTAGVADAGDVITYTFTVTNDGNVDIDDVSIADALPGLSAITPAAVATVAEGDDATFTATYTVTQADVDAGGAILNTATASGEDPTGSPVVSPADDASVDLVDADPSLAVVKDAELTTDGGTAGVADAGDVITYTFTVTNDGNVTVDDVEIDDALPGLSAITPASVATLAPSADAVFTATYTVTQADVDSGGKVVNTATATGTDPSGGDVTSPSDGADVDLVTRAPGLELEKGSVLADTNNNGVADKGETITYSFRAENTGNVTLTGVSIDDAMAGLSAVTPASATVAPGASATFAATYVVTQADVDAGGSLVNTATASGTGPGGGSVTSDPDGSSTGLVPHAPGLSIDKVSELDDANNNGLADVDETISYTFTVQNTGNVTISGISVTDPMVSGVSPSNVTLAPGASRVFTADDYVVTQADVDWGSVVNIATVTGTRPGGAVVSEDDVDTVDTVDPVAELDVVKSSALTIDKAVSGKADVGDEVTYTFVVTNTGTGTAHDVAIVDALPGLSAVTPSSVVDLAPGASATFTATYAVKLKDLKVGEIVNVAKASFVPPNPGGGPAPDPLVSGPSNVVKVPGGPTQPSLSTKASAKRVVLGVGGSGRTGSVELFDTVTLKEFVAGSTSVGRATLYGPTAKRSASMCVPGNKVRTVTFKPRNGVSRTPKVRVNEPGYYTWVVTTSADEENLAASHGCGLASETTLVHRPGYGVVRIDTGASVDFFARLANPSRVKIKALGMDAVVQPAGKPGGVMRIPGDVSVGGWLSSSAAPGERVGSAVVAGHVSDMGDRPGQFGKLNKARKGQVVAVTGADGKVQRYRISKVYSQLRTKRLASSLFSTRGAHQLVLVTCTGKVTGPGGRFHYTRNQVVIAKPIR